VTNLIGPSDTTPPSPAANAVILVIVSLEMTNNNVYENRESWTRVFHVRKNDGSPKHRIAPGSSMVIRFEMEQLTWATPGDRWSRPQ